MSNKKTNNLKKGKSANIETKPKLSASAITIIAVSALLALTLLVGLIFIIIDHAKKEEDKNFGYLSSDLSKYISIDKALYKDYKVNLAIAKPKEIDTDIAILNLLASKKGGVLHNGVAQEEGTITPGDVVNIFYRGYIVGDNGEEIFVDNVCNFASTDSSGNYVYASLEIGSNRFVPGFEFNLSGKEFTAANKFVRITEGKVSAEQIVYVSYTKVLDGSTANKDKVSISAERVVLSDGKEKIDAKYGDGFYDKLLTLDVGAKDGVTFEGTVSGKKYNYSSLKVNFATTCEKEGNYILVDCYFPYDYGAATLNNKNARFEVYIQSVVEYEEAKLTNEFVEENLGKDDFGVKKEDLEEFEGDRVSQLRQYVKKLLDDEYEEVYRTKLEEAMWDHYHNKDVSIVTKYPASKVDSIYNEYYNDVLYQFEQSGGVISDALGTSKTCETVDEYAIIYLGLEYAENQDWRSVLRTMSEGLVKERLILYYIMRNENIVPTAEEHAARKKEVEKEYFDEYVLQYCEEYSIDKSTYSEEGWAEFEAERYEELHNYYDSEYFDEVTYYELALDHFLEWPTVTTLDTLETSDK